MIYSESGSTATPCRSLCGITLAKIRLDARHKAKLALDIAEGRVLITDPTITQAARLIGVPEASVRAIRRQHRQPKQRSSADRLTLAWVSASETARQEFISRAGPDEVFNVVCRAL